MPVTLGLESLVPLAGSRHLWPKEFEELVRAIEANADDRTLWNAAADWCFENEEKELEAGFRFVANRPSVAIKQRSDGHQDWFFRDLPRLLDCMYPGGTFDDTTIAGAVARLVKKIRMAQKELEV